MDDLVEVLVCHSFCSGIVDLGYILSDQIQTVMSIQVEPDYVGDSSQAAGAISRKVVLAM